MPAPGSSGGTGEISRVKSYKVTCNQWLAILR
jgi:hypothetical protein